MKEQTDQALLAPFTLAGAISIGLGTAGYAQVESFTNDGSFDWSKSPCLDIMLPASDQSDACQSASVFEQFDVSDDPDACGYYYDEDTGEYWWEWVYTDEEFIGGNDLGSGLSAAWFKGDWFIEPLAAGEVVGPARTWKEAAVSGKHITNYCDGTDSVNSPLEADKEAFLAVRFRLNGSLHYGWIQVRVNDPGRERLEALAWGYQREPDVPIYAGQTEGDWCATDMDRSGVLDIFDFLMFFNLFNDRDTRADCDKDGLFDLFDFICYITAFNDGC